MSQKNKIMQIENPKIGSKIRITHIGDVNGSRYYTSSMGKCPQDIIFPYETVVTDAKIDSTYNAFSDGTFGFWTEKTKWEYVTPNYEIY